MGLRLVATRGDDTLKLYGVPDEAIVEARLQDTISGHLTVEITGVPDNEGTVLIHYPNFGQHVSPAIRILNGANVESVTQLVFSPSASEEGKLVYITAQEYAASVGAHMADAQHVSVPEIPEPKAAEKQDRQAPSLEKVRKFLNV